MATTDNFNFIHTLLNSGLIVQSVLMTLFLCSLISWFIFIKKRSDLAMMQKYNKEFLFKFNELTNLNDIFNVAKEMKDSPYAHMFKRGHEELLKVRNKLSGNNPKNSLHQHFSQFGLSALERALRKAANECNLRMNAKISVLASIGSLSPFIGLFGTVWGILRTLQGLSGGDVGLDIVAPGIAETLVATGIGLAVAIPAVFFYNMLLQKMKMINQEMDSFAQDFLNIVERSLITPA